ncbi:hypothetical protein DPMN_121600 [Dreissena polymorpha]|uniref:Sulfotransferase domain-containing protein n=1 Tax=Dreissena polymorpha TaxID=45954 RepID=A0A9D4JT99_DREPO|nr:hypothetical protein DPMN_121600 [Dreissena polymorpha]
MKYRGKVTVLLTTLVLATVCLWYINDNGEQNVAINTSGVRFFTAATLAKSKSFCTDLGTNYLKPEWDFRRYERPKFLTNYKNPCYLGRRMTNNESLVEGRALHCLPYFIVAGFPKSGTTDLWARLFNHAEIHIKHGKEPRFFNIGRFTAPFERVMVQYIRMFARSTIELQTLVAPLDCGHEFPYHHGITGEATVDASFDIKDWRQVPGNENCSEPAFTNADVAYHLNPNMKIIFVVRNPVDRAYSDYIYEARFLRYPTNPQLFHAAVIDAMRNHTDCWRHHHSVRACAYNNTIESMKVRLRVGMYHIFIQDWIDVFSSDNILVIKAEDTMGPPKIADVYNRIFSFLSVRPFTRMEEMEVFQRGPVNVRSKHERNIGEMLPETRKMLESFYRPFNEALRKLIPEIDYNAI